MDSREYQAGLVTLPKKLAFDRAEYRDRVSKVTAAMGREGVDALVVTSAPDICYLAGYAAYAAHPVCLVVFGDERQILHVPSIEIPAAVLSSAIDDVRPYDWHDTDGLLDGVVSAVRKTGANAIGIALSNESPSVNFYLGLKLRVPQAQFRDVPPGLFGVRLAKTPAEVEHLRKAGRISVAGIQASISAICPGNSDNNVAGAGYAGMLRAGSDYLCLQPIVAAGYRSSLTHGTFGNQRLNEGDTILMEYGGCYRRYTAPFTRTAVIGEPAPLVRRVADAVRSTLDTLIDHIRPGLPAAEVAAKAQVRHAHISEAFFAGVYGYSVGLGLPPTWNERLFFLTRENENVLQAGMVLHLVPFLRAPGKFGVGLSETVVITDSGCEVLTCPDGASMKRDLIVVPSKPPQATDNHPTQVRSVTAVG